MCWAGQWKAASSGNPAGNNEMFPFFAGWGRRQLPLGRKRQGSVWKEGKRLTCSRKRVNTAWEGTHDVFGVQHAVSFCGFVYVHAHLGELKDLFPEGSDKPMPFNLWGQGSLVVPLGCWQWGHCSVVAGWIMNDGMCPRPAKEQLEQRPAAELGPTRWLLLPPSCWEL